MIRQFELVERVQSYDPDADEDMLNRAYVYGLKKHGTQLRASGDPYFSHPVEVAGILAEMRLDTASIVTGLLHDTIEDTDADVDDVRERFGDRVARVVAAVTEDPAIPDYHDRKAALRAQVAAAGADAHAVFAADKLVKARELRAHAAREPGALGAPALRRRLEHYEQCLAMLRTVAPDMPMVHQLAFELWALRTLPPEDVRPRRAAAARPAARAGSRS
jgi:guanosine-3',5'-bis(diphosphate) 3'-pyrophosphohydrolase